MSAENLDDLEDAELPRPLEELDAPLGTARDPELPGLDDEPVPVARELELDPDAMRTFARPSADTRPVVVGTIPSMAAIRIHGTEPSSPPPVASPPPSLSPSSGPLASDRSAHDEPRAGLLTLPLAFVLAILVVSTDFGRLLAMPVSIQFHELGHAIVAYLTGRFAIPMPCGLTLWSAESSIAAHLVVLLVSALLAIRGLRERAPFPVALAAAIEVAHVAFTFVVSDQVAAILLAGGAAELVLPGLAMVSFYFRMPDRLRWDFFRFLVVPAGAVAYVDGMYLWFSVLTGRMPAPMGSLLGTTGDGSGDLDRLVHDHGYLLVEIVRGYATLGIVVGAVVLGVYAWFAKKAIAALRLERDA